MLFKELTDTERCELFKRDGREEGMEAERRKNAKAMRNEGMDPDTIARITGLTVDDILRL